MCHSSFCQEISHKQDTLLEFYEFQYQLTLPHSLLTYLHLSADIGTLMVSAFVVPSCVNFVFQAFFCCTTVHYQAGSLFNLDSLPVTTTLLD